MSYINTGLSRILELFQVSLPQRVSMIKTDAVRAARAEKSPDGGNCYQEFWCDGKRFLAEPDFDLAKSLAARSGDKKRNQNIFMRLLRGLAKCRTELFHRVLPADVRPDNIKIKGTWEAHDHASVVRVQNVLALRDGEGRLHLIYPYFSQKAALGASRGAVGLAMLQEIVANDNPATISIIDVIKGETYSTAFTPFTGKETEDFRERYGGAMREWRNQYALGRGR